MEVDEKFWKEVERFGKFLFQKGCFLFFSSRRAIATSTPCPGLGEAMHVRPDRVMSWSVGSLPTRRGRGPLVHVDRVGLRLDSTRACNGHHTHRKDYKEDGRNAFDCVSLFLT